MKIKVEKKSYEEVMALPRGQHKPPRKPSKAFGALIRALAKKDLKATNFTYEMVDMEKLDPNQPCLILMNHSCFLDLEICAHIFKDRPYNIVCTSDGFVGKEGLMRRIGCIPTQKFVTDVVLLRDMKYALTKLKTSILMYPEASYSFDGTATPLPPSVGKCLKMLGVPVVMVKTYGAFSRDPLYNNLQLRKVDVSAKVKYLLSPEDIEAKSPKELNEILKEEFTFDNFRWQQENRIRIEEDFRADYLNRVLYKCPHCLMEGRMVGKGTKLACKECGSSYELTEHGALEASDGLSVFTHVPDWYQWERECVRKELEEGSYRLDIPVDICMLVDAKAIYQVGRGRLVHDINGFHLTGCDGKLDYKQTPEVSYSLYADYYWYELGDMICIGNQDALYYCFPDKNEDYAAKTRIATEELYKMRKRGKKD